MAGADAPPNCSAETRDGRTLYDANSVGNDEADSLSVLQIPKLVLVARTYHEAP